MTSLARLTESSNPATPRRHRAGAARDRAAAVAWCSILAGAASGLVMGLWSFGGPMPTPEWIGEYDALPRRFLRLTHVALFALGMLHLMLLRQLARTPAGPGLDRAALAAMAFGNLAMPLALGLAARWEALKYLTPLPAAALAFAIAVAALGALRRGMGGYDDTE